MVVTLGEILLRLKAPHRERFLQSAQFEATFAGGEVNVAVALAHLGIPTIFASILPQTPMSESAAAFLRKDGVNTQFLQTGKGRLGLYFFEEGAAQRPNKVFFDSEGTSMSLAQAGSWDWIKLFKDQKWLHISGLTPGLSESCRQLTHKAMDEARKQGLTISLDLNYRKHLWNYGSSAQEVMPEIVRKAHILFADETDTQQALGIPLESPLDIAKGEIDYEAYKILGKKVMDAYPNLKSFTITLRESLNADHNRWSALLFEGNQDFNSNVYDIYPIVEQTGAGGAFAAGMIYGSLMMKNSQDRLEFAAALGCLKHSLPGDQARLSVQEVEALASGLESGRVDR